MVRQGWRWAWRAFWGILLLPWHYRKTFWHLVRQPYRWRRVWRFWQVKLLARGERVGLQLLDPLSLLKPAWTPFPRMIEIEITTRCYLKCSLCESTYFPADYRRQSDLTYPQFYDLMRQFPDLRYINLTGMGSSFLNPDFEKMLAFCFNHDIYMTVIDSFNRLSFGQMHSLIHYGVKKIPVSLDAATPEVYVKVREGGDFFQVLENIRLFRALRELEGSPYPEMAFRYIFDRDNWQDIVAYPDLIYSLVKDNRSDGIDGMVEFAALLEFEQTKDWVVELPPEVVQETEKKLHAYGLPHAWSHPSHRPEQKRPMQECAAWAEPYIMAGGYVVPCCSVLMSNRRPFLEQHAFGNVREQDFRVIWDSPRYRDFRLSVPRSTGPVPVLCQGCRAFDTTVRENRHGVIN